MVVVVLLLLHYNVYCKKIVQHLLSNSAGNIFTWNNSFSARIRSIAMAHSHFGSLVRMEPSRPEPEWHTIMRESPRIFQCSLVMPMLSPISCCFHCLYCNPHSNPFAFHARTFQSIFFHSLFVSPSNFLCAQFMAKKMFYDKMFRYCLHTAKLLLSLSLYLSGSFRQPRETC